MRSGRRRCTISRSCPGMRRLDMRLMLRILSCRSMSSLTSRRR
nr:TPA_asm: m26.6 sORF 2 [Murid betaherpesvirus 1]DBA07754.1 TPA_asm: m26.6 sORF 2 [Murid betaherpesvirus 1]